MAASHRTRAGEAGCSLGTLNQLLEPPWQVHFALPEEKRMDFLCGPSQPCAWYPEDSEILDWLSRKGPYPWHYSVVPKVWTRTNIPSIPWDQTPLGVCQEFRFSAFTPGYIVRHLGWGGPAVCFNKPFRWLWNLYKHLSFFFFILEYSWLTMLC